VKDRKDFAHLQTTPEATNIRGDIPMKAIIVTDQTAGTAGMKLVERPEPKAAIGCRIRKELGLLSSFRLHNLHYVNIFLE
jgi:hypothetical protein